MGTQQHNWTLNPGSFDHEPRALAMEPSRYLTPLKIPKLDEFKNHFAFENDSGSVGVNALVKVIGRWYCEMIVSDSPVAETRYDSGYLEFAFFSKFFLSEFLLS